MNNKIKTLLTVLLLTCLAAAPATAKKGKTYIVCVGISEYKTQPLRTPAHNAETIMKVFQKAGKTEARLVTNSQATSANVLAAMKQLYAKAGKDDAIVFFYSGHGSPGSFDAYDNTNLMHSDVLQVMKNSKAGRKIMLVEACFSGSMRRETREGRQATLVKKMGATTMKKAKKAGIMMFLSSLDNETSMEYNSWNNAVFTAHLQYGLRGGADKNEDKVITAKELYDFVTPAVEKVTNQEMHPVMWGNFDNNMPVISWK
jgi:uncharacterized caspase-like protein